MFFHKRHPPAGSRPGTLAIPPESPPPAIHVIRYGPERFERRTLASPDELPDLLGDGHVTWIDVHGMGDEAVLRRLGVIFGLHPLALEDAVNVPQRPKSEAYERCHLFVTRMGRLAEGLALESEQISIFLGARYVLTLQERPGDPFDPVRQRLEAGKGIIREMGADYLAYALIDTVIDAYYPILESLGDTLEQLEDDLLERTDGESLRRVQRVRRELHGLRRAVWPQREAVSALIREESPLISPPVRLYLRDCQDHAMQIVDVSESYRDLAGNLMDMYLSTVSLRTNEVMKVLTIMASIFIPLTFLAGVYGMNFEHIPELKARWAYPAFWAVTVLGAVAMLGYFRRKGWLGGDDG